MTTSVLLLPDGRRVEHPEPVDRGHVLELGGSFYLVEQVAAGTLRGSGQPVTLAVLSTVKP